MSEYSVKIVVATHKKYKNAVRRDVYSFACWCGGEKRFRWK